MHYTSNKILKSFLILFFGLTAIAQMPAQTSTRAQLMFFDEEQGIEISDSEGFMYDFLDFGMEIRPGDTIRTRNSSAELELQPDGSIIRIAENSVFTVKSLLDSESENEFSLLNGKMRAVVSNESSSNFTVHTRTAVGVVRGTDFIMHVIPDERDAIYVSNGIVDFSKLESEQTVSVQQGQGADTFAEALSANLLSDDVISEFTRNMNFSALNPDAVPQQFSFGDEEQQATRDIQTDVTTPAIDRAPPPAAPTPAQDRDGVMGDAIRFFGGYLNMELGSIIIGGETYGKVVLQPEFEIDKLGIGLYLPVIYQNNLFAPDTWFKPAGNNEWSFGTDPDYTSADDEAWLRIHDFWIDLWLKIRYVRWAQQQDAFFAHAGNISSMTLGHGLLMHRYANDTDFPQVRRVGLNIGLDHGKVGAQFIANDMAQPEILGARFFFRPTYPTSQLAFGLSGTADINPAHELIPDEDLSFSIETNEAEPMFFNAALDIDIPIIENSELSMILFSDVGAFIPYLKSAPENSDLKGGLQFQAFYDGSGFSFSNFKNYGAISGILGNLFGVDYRLEYRHFFGIFEPLYNATYERFRPTHARTIVGHLIAPEQDDRSSNRVHAIYGEAGMDILNDMLRFDVGYMWPWDSVNEVDTDDYLMAGISIDDNLLPYGIAGSINYTRHGFSQAIRSDSETSLFDSKTTFEGELTYPVAPGMKLAVSVGTSAKRDAQGNLEYDANGNLQSEFNLGIETRIGY